MYPDLHFFGMSLSTYNMMYLVGFIGMALLCIFTRKKYNINLIEAIAYTLATYVSGVGGAMVMSKIYMLSLDLRSGGEYIPVSGVCLFGALVFLPVFIVVMSKIGKKPFGTLMDFMTPGIYIILAFSKLGCFLGGCCYGIADANGVYNHNLDYKVFPVQLYESICTFAVFAVLMILLFAVKKRKPGSLYPIGMMIYGVVRFIWENFRYYGEPCEKNFFMGLTYWQCWAIISVAIGAVWLIILLCHKNRDKKAEETA